MQHHIIVVHILHDLVFSSLKRHTSHTTVPRKSASPKQTLSWAADRARDGYAKLRWKRCQSNAWFTLKATRTQRCQTARWKPKDGKAKAGNVEGVPGILLAIFKRSQRS